MFLLAFLHSTGEGEEERGETSSRTSGDEKAHFPFNSSRRVDDFTCGYPGENTKIDLLKSSERKSNESKMKTRREEKDHTRKEDRYKSVTERGTGWRKS